MRVLKLTDERILQLRERPNVTLIEAPELFIEEAQIRPSINSNIHYDAKLWRFIKQQIQEDDLWWNVAR